MKVVAFAGGKYPQDVLVISLIYGWAVMTWITVLILQCNGGIALLKFTKEHPNCTVDRDPFKLLNGVCDGGDYNTQECGYENGDCLDCSVEYPYLIGNGKCNVGGDYNTRECGYDGGDCVISGYPGCHVYDPSKIEDGTCNGFQYNTELCGWGGGDRLEFNNEYPVCDVLHPSYIGNGICDGSRYNKTECEWDGGDCLL